MLLRRSTVSNGDAAADTGNSESIVDSEQVATTIDVSSTPSAASDTIATAAPSQDFDDHESGLISESNHPIKSFPAETICGTTRRFKHEY